MPLRNFTMSGKHLFKKDNHEGIRGWLEFGQSRNRDMSGYFKLSFIKKCTRI